MTGTLSRRRAIATLGAASLVAPWLVRSSAGAATRRVPVYVGTYTQGTKSRGIYFLSFDPDTGSLGPARLVAETVNPSFLAIHPSKPWLFAVNEVERLDGQPSGGVSGFVIGDEGLTAINSQSSAGTNPCHLAIDPTGDAIWVANYSSGALGVESIASDTGALKSFGVAFYDDAHSVNPQRQEGPHAHCVRFHPSGKFLIAADLGADRVRVFRSRSADRADSAPRTLELVHTIATRAGSGPRHLGFHPSGRSLFVNGELDSTLNSYRFDPETGRTEPIESISTLPAGGHPGNSTAETVVHPAGKFVYVSNRGHDTIARFRFDADSVKLTALGQTPTGGKTPRNFNIDPSGNWLLAANQDSGTVTVFRIDQNSGELSRVGEPLEVPAPVCLVFAAR